METKRRRGRPVGMVYKHQVMVRLTDGQVGRLDAVCEKYDLNRSLVIRDCVAKSNLEEVAREIAESRE